MNIKIQRATSQDAYSMRQVLRQTWIATYPNTEYKITKKANKKGAGTSPTPLEFVEQRFSTAIADLGDVHDHSFDHQSIRLGLVWTSCHRCARRLPWRVLRDFCPRRFLRRILRWVLRHPVREYQDSSREPLSPWRWAESTESTWPGFARPK